MEKYLTQVNFNQSNDKKNEFIVIHYTANNGDTALGNAKYFYSENRGASAHYFVDENKIIQVVENKDVAWHCGTSGTYKHATCRNTNSIGIEMCSRIDENGNYYFMQNTIKQTQELVNELMNQYNVPLQNVIRHYDVTGKSCPAPYVDTTAWNNFKNGLNNNNNSTTNLTPIITTIKTNITNKQNLINFLCEKNNNLAINNYDLDAFVSSYIEFSNLYNIDFSIIFAQACIETGYLKFGGDVLISQNNFCGLGAVGNGEKGCSFNSITDGVKAHAQHLKAYIDKEEVTDIIDPRFKYVARGTAPYVEYLSIPNNPNGTGWAMDNNYSQKIKSLSVEIAKIITKETVSENEIPDWGAESWAKFTEKKLMDGTRAGDNVTRLELTVILDRLITTLQI